jgi:tRNA A-37 threonylcarbamoyl transferase component Bud32/ligand-binding sensor domain-containing protein
MNIFQDSHGRLWLGGLDLACFDGTRFFSLRDYGFPAVQSFSVTEDASGAIWISAETGVYRFAQGHVEEVARGLAMNVIPIATDTVVVAMGKVGTGVLDNKKLIRIRRANDKWETEALIDLNSAGPLTLDSKGMILYPWPDRGWYELRREDVVRWMPGTELPVIRHDRGRAPGNGGIGYLRDRAGCLWMGSTRGTFYDCGDGKTLGAPYQDAEVSATMHEADDGSMVLLGGSLLAVGRPGAFKIATRANGLPGLADAMLARDGTVWLGTGSGLYRYPSPFRIEYWTIREGLPTAPWSITRNGKKTYAGITNQIVALNKDRSRWEPLTTFKTDGTVAGLLGEKDGSVLAAFMDGGMAQIALDGKVVARGPREKFGSVMRLTEGGNGDIWSGGTFLGRVTRAGDVLKLEKYDLQTKPSGNVLGVKYDDQSGKLWACYNGGLVVRDKNGSWREFTTKDGLAMNGCWSVAPLPNGDLWYAYFMNNAMARIQFDAAWHPTIRQYDISSGVPEPGNDAIDSDQRGWVWRGGNLGAYVADASEAEAGNWVQLSQSDGFPANGMNTGSVFTDTDGSMWWGADNDLAHYIPPADLVNPKFAPQVFVSAFSWDGGAPRMAEAVGELPHGSKVIVHIGSLQFDRRNALKLRYRVLPEQSNWRETSNLDLALDNLKWGSHTLEVQARVFTGPWSESVRRTIAVLPPPWLSRPFLYAYMIVIAVFFVFYFFLHRKRVLREQTSLPELASLRLSVLVPEVQEFVGTLLDSRFEVGEPIAQGGFAYVMQGVDRQQKRPCAIKVFRNEVGKSESMKRRFEQEVSALQQVRHPNVVSIVAHGTTSLGVPYLVMEFVEGKSLREVLNSGPLAPMRTARLLRQLAEALEAIHLKGICHRDVKPENVMIRNSETSREEVVLIDFSISIVKEANETLHGLSRAAGTFEYMAPEQAIGYAQPSSDIYSLAKVVIEMFTGQRLASLLPNASMDLPVQVRKLLASLPVRLSESSINLISTALEFDPSRRPESATTFAMSIVQDLEMEPLNV